MRKCVLKTPVVVAALTLCLLVGWAGAAEARKEFPPRLKILYAGLPDTDRAKDFLEFLGEHFGTVETTDYNTFTGSEAKGFDVTIIDHDGADTKAPRLRLSPQYAHATITVGVPGAFLCSGLSLKTGYL
jgi:hypothetical protein